MPDSLLLQIADNLIAKSAAAGFLSTGLLTDVGKMWAEEPNDTAAYLGDGGEAGDPGPTQSMSPTARFFWHVIVKGDAAQRAFYGFLKKLKDAVDADPSLGGLATGDRAALVVGYEVLNTSANIAGHVFVADVFVEVDYRHSRGQS